MFAHLTHVDLGLCFQQQSPLWDSRASGASPTSSVQLACGYLLQTACPCFHHACRGTGASIAPCPLLYCGLGLQVAKCTCPLWGFNPVSWSPQIFLTSSRPLHPWIISLPFPLPICPPYMGAGTCWSVGRGRQGQGWVWQKTACLQVSKIWHGKWLEHLHWVLQAGNWWTHRRLQKSLAKGASYI